MKMKRKSKLLMKEMRDVCIKYLHGQGVYDFVDSNYVTICRSLETSLGMKSNYHENISKRLGHLYKVVTGNEPLVEIETTVRRNKKEPKKRPDFSDTMNAKIEDFYASYRWRKARYLVLLKHGGHCAACGRSKNDGVAIHVDHIKPLRKNWNLRLDPENLQPLCEECNHGKGNWDSTNWLLPRENISTNLKKPLVDLRSDFREFFSEWYFWDNLDQSLQSELVEGLVLLLRARV